MRPAPEEERPPSLVKLRVDRHALALIAEQKDVLSALFQISFFITGIRSTDQLLDRFLELIFGPIPAKRGAILLTGSNPKEFEFTTYRGEPFEIDMNLAAQTLAESEAVMRHDGDSVLCAPLRVFTRKFGVVYLHSSEVPAFALPHFYLLIAAASIAAVTLEHTLYSERMESENQRLQEEIHIQHGIVGEGPRMREVNSFISKVAASDSTVLILGESGTGKELVSRAIHRNSHRSAGPLVTVNCAAIVDTLVESELFGNEKGAFTGAAELRKGKIEAAGGGTLFLDEIGELSMPMQAALLRFLQEREFHRVGGTRLVRVDTRVIAATNRNLEERVQEGRFRQDLFFRLKVVELHMPSLSERREDIPALTDHFIKKYRHVRIISGITPEARRALAGHRWPGNVRELQNTIERALVLGTSSFIQASDLPAELTRVKATDVLAGAGISAEGEQFKFSRIERVLRETEGRVAKAARILDLSASYLHRLIREGKVKLP